MKIGQTSVVHLTSRLAVSIVGFVATVYLARELGSETLGTYFLIVSVLYWLVVFGDFGTSTAVRKRLSEHDSSSGVLTAGIILQAGLFLIISTTVLVARPLLNDYLDATVALWMVIMLLAKLLFDFVLVVLEGQHRVHVSSLLHPLDRTVRSVTQILLIALGAGVVGLLVGYLAGATVAIIVGAYLARTRLKLPEIDDFRSLISFAKYAWLGNIKSRAFLSMDTVILGFFITTNSVIGIYEIAWNIAAIFAIFGNSLNKAIFPEISSLGEGQTERIRDLTSASIAYAGIFLIPGLVGAALVGDVVLIIYGPEFADGAAFLIVLTVSQLVYVYEEQFITVLAAMDYPDKIFRINSVFIVTNLALNLLLIPSIGWIGAAMATTVSAATGLTLSYRSLRQVLAFELPIDELLRQVAAALIMGGIVYVGRTVFGDSLSVVIPLVGLGAGIYFFVLLLLSTRFRTTVLENIPIQTVLGE
jgi:O-antigen/teichoic acid export membrane protein